MIGGEATAVPIMDSGAAAVVATKQWRRCGCCGNNATAASQLLWRQCNGGNVAALLTIDNGTAVWRLQRQRG